MWAGAWRSNGFLVKDPEAFVKWAESIYDLSFERVPSLGPKGYLVQVSEDSDSGSLPTSRWDDDGGDIEFDFETELAGHLLEGSVAIIKYAGFDKLRSIGGFALAINSLGETVSTGLSEIDFLARRLTDRPDGVLSCSDEGDGPANLVEVTDLKWRGIGGGYEITFAALPHYGRLPALTLMDKKEAFSFQPLPARTWMYQVKTRTSLDLVLQSLGRPIAQVEEQISDDPAEMEFHT